MTAPGRGARPSKIGQVGLRCFFCKDVPKNKLTKQAVCFPSKRETIFESVRNYQRTHMMDCPYFPEQMKAEYERFSNLCHQCDTPLAEHDPVTNYLGFKLSFDFEPWRAFLDCILRLLSFVFCLGFCRYFIPRDWCHAIFAIVLIPWKDYFMTSCVVLAANFILTFSLLRQ